MHSPVVLFGCFEFHIDCRVGDDVTDFAEETLAVLGGLAVGEECGLAHAEVARVVLSLRRVPVEDGGSVGDQLPHEEDELLDVVAGTEVPPLRGELEGLEGVAELVGVGHYDHSLGAIHQGFPDGTIIIIPNFIKNVKSYALAEDDILKTLLLVGRIGEQGVCLNKISFNPISL